MQAARAFTIFLAAALLAGCGGGGGSSPLPGRPAPTPTATSSSGTAAAFTCPAANTVASATRSSSLSAREAVRRGPMPAVGGAALAATTTLIAVTYDRAAESRSRSTFTATERRLGGTPVTTLEHAHTGLTTHILAVKPGTAAAVEAALRGRPGVRSVGSAGSRRYETTVTQPYFPSDPYFDGFAQPLAINGTTPAPTFEVGPYEESANVPGQWDKHAVGLEYAFGYSQIGNGSSIVNAAALGSTSVKIAVIDTGADTSHPDLASKVTYARCFITSGSTQSTSNFTTDPDGHGTNVAGIAGAAIGNGVGFAGSAGNAVLYDYRIYPTPDNNCLLKTTTDARCGASTIDVASAIEDAIAAGANVINLSLGADACVNGADPDTVEGNAIADAIAANVVVVAAAGNGAAGAVSAPGCDPGVIAVGASALGDGSPNGAKNSRGSATSPVEYLASYSNYGSPGAALNSASAWGIVAPGGDPSGNTDADDLHWIENAWTSTPIDSNFAGSCTVDYPGTGTTVDCRSLLAGTSMAAPQVAGAAALVLSVSSSYQSPARMKQLLCASAHDIGDPHEGCGRLNVYRAVATALGDPSLPPN